MPLSTAQHKSITESFPDMHFTLGDTFSWSPATRTVTFDPSSTLAVERLLHEIAHAELKHTTYHRDIELIAFERDAWQHAKTVLAPKFSSVISADVIEDDLDTYRDWLHARSTCPTCSATGLQTNDKQYTCVACHAVWRVNEATTCGLKRYTKKRPS